jgi:hypothetical protein
MGRFRWSAYPVSSGRGRTRRGRAEPGASAAGLRLRGRRQGLGEEGGWAGRPGRSRGGETTGMFPSVRPFVCIGNTRSNTTAGPGGRPDAFDLSWE